MSCNYFKLVQKVLRPEIGRTTPITYEGAICRAGVDTFVGGAVTWEKCIQASPDDPCHVLPIEHWEQWKRVRGLS